MATKTYMVTFMLVVEGDEDPGDLLDDATHELEIMDGVVEVSELNYTETK